MKRKKTPFQKSKVYVVIFSVLLLIAAVVSMFVLEPVLKEREAIRQATRMFIEATAEGYINQTQQVYIANSTATPVSNLQATLAAVETEVIASVVIEEAETVEAYRSTYLTPAPTLMSLIDAATATQSVILTQIALTQTPTPP